MTTTTESLNLKAVGFNDEQTECDACGRMELKGTVIIAEDGAEIGRYGTTCASRILAPKGDRKITRSDALKIEMGRRQAVVHILQLAQHELKQGRPELTRVHLTELDRYYILHRADEQRFYDKLRAAIA